MPLRDYQQEALDALENYIAIADWWISALSHFQHDCFATESYGWTPFVAKKILDKSWWYNVPRTGRIRSMRGATDEETQSRHWSRRELRRGFNKDFDEKMFIQLWRQAWRGSCRNLLQKSFYGIGAELQVYPQDWRSTWQQAGTWMTKAKRNWLRIGRRKRARNSW